MFSSFFPKHKLFFISFLLVSFVSIACWYMGLNNLYTHFGFLPPDPKNPVIGVKLFYTPYFLWFDLYYWSWTLMFYWVWKWVSKSPYINWSVLGTGLILFITYIQVQVSVAINSWYGPFYDLIQKALSHSGNVTLTQFYGELLTFAYVAFFAVIIGVSFKFFVSHYVFRWRIAMNSFYMTNWEHLRKIEGAAQRVQEDTMRFASTTESLGISFINSFMTLIAFLPVLVVLSEKIKIIPIFGEVSHPLVLAAIFWSLFGTVFLALIGIKLPGLQFNNQKVEAAYRKELVYGEDHENRAQPQTIKELFADVKKNYFRLYFHYAYFNVGRIVYLQSDNIFPYLILAPSIVGGVITLGLLNQILNSFDQVRSSFQYLVSSWTDIVEWLSIYKRLRAFEKSIQKN